MSDKDKIKLLNTNNKNEMRAELEKMKRDLPEFIEYTSVLAKIRKASFDALVEQGFTEPQALELCKSMEL